MKKLIFSLGAALLISLASCGGVDSKISKINDLAKENKELASDPVANAEKISKNAAEITKITNELANEKLSDEQKQNLIKAAAGNL